MSENDETTDEETFENAEEMGESGEEAENETESEAKDETEEGIAEDEETEEPEDEETEEPEDEEAEEPEDEEAEEIVDEEEEEDELDLPTPSEPTDLRDELQRTYHDELSDRNERKPGRGRENAMRVPTAVAEATTEKLEPYLWDHWEEPLEDEQIDKEDFHQLATLPQSDAFRWLKDEVSWEYYVRSIEKRVKRRDELLG